MNKERRKAITNAIDKLNEAITELETCRDEEQEYLDNMPENLQGSEKYDLAEQAVSYLDDAIDSISEAIDNADSATE